MKATRKRQFGATVLCSSASALWIASASAGIGGHVTPGLATVGVLIPFGVGGLTLWLTEQRAATDLQSVPARSKPSADREKAGAR